MPSRRLTRPRFVRRATTLEVATTVIRPTPDATFRGNPSATFRNGTRNTPPPSPSMEPRPPAAAPATTTRATMRPVISGKEAEEGRYGRVRDAHVAGGLMDDSRIVLHVPALLRTRPPSELVSHRMRSNTARSRGRSDP